jgi:hypothetical protein
MHRPMKGVVFTEFLEMVETRFDPELADRIIQAAHVPSAGAYTAVGSYDHGEMWSLVAELSKATEIPAPDLLRAFGQYLFGRFVLSYPRLFEGVRSCFDFLEGLDGVIHVEVRKLYPDAEVPHFEVLERSATRMVLLYESARHFADLAEGLMHGCGAHFGERLTIARESLPAEAGSRVRFTLERG